MSGGATNAEHASTGILWGIGLGPGDPELLTVRAARLIGEVDVIAYHSARHGRSISRATAAPYLRGDQIEEHLVYPLTTETTDHPGGYDGALADFYAEAAQRLAAHLSAGRSVGLLAAGDPTFYSSYMHLHRRLAHRFEARIVPGVTSVSAASAAIGDELVTGEETLTVLPGTLDVADLTARLAASDAAAIVKLGRTFAGVRRALEQSGRLDRARYVERASTDRQRVEPAAAVDPESVPYFSLVVVPPARTTPELAGHPTDTDTPGSGEVVVIGLGPGPDGLVTPEAAAELRAATDIVGYTTYVDRVPVRAGQRRHASDNRVESERAAMALDLAAGGRRVAVVSSGDPGVFAMASAVLEVACEPSWSDIPVRVIPGVTAANAVAARIGAPLGHDYAVISLSDRLKPWEVITRRLEAAAAADLAIAVYNPGSASRIWQVDAMRDVLLEHRSADTPVVIGRAVGSAQERVWTVRLADLAGSDVDMRCLLIIGSSTSRVVERAAGPAMYTPRRYGDDAVAPAGPAEPRS